jgi:hypothetical protein
MQTILGYLYDNLVVVQLNEDAGTLIARNNVVYARGVKLFKGVDNIIQLQFKNQEQKPIDLTGRTIEMNLMDTANLSAFVTKPGTITNATGGLATVGMTESDTRNLTSKKYTYSIKVTDADLTEHVIYADDSWNAGGTIALQDKVYPVFVPSRAPVMGTEAVGVSYSATVSANPNMNSNQALHTAAYNLAAFSGTVEVEATLEQTATEWFVVDTSTYTLDSGYQYTNFNGVFANLRFKVTRTSGTFSGMLYRP